MDLITLVIIVAVILGICYYAIHLNWTDWRQVLMFVVVVVLVLFVLQYVGFRIPNVFPGRS